MLTRYLIRVANITIGSGSNASSIAYEGARGIANLDTGAFAALQIGPEPYQVWNQMTTANIAAAAGGPWTVTACNSEGNAVCSVAGNANPSAACGRAAWLQPVRCVARFARCASPPLTSLPGTRCKLNGAIFACRSAPADSTTRCLQIVLAKGNRAQAMKAAAYLQK